MLAFGGWLIGRLVRVGRTRGESSGEAEIGVGTAAGARSVAGRGVARLRRLLGNECEEAVPALRRGARRRTPHRRPVEAAARALRSGQLRHRT
eukprot:2239859-Prymnesium_polylepis.3